MKYILAGVTPSYSHRNSCPMWRIHWYCVDDNTMWEMTVDESYENWDHWRDFVATKNYGIYADLKRTRRTTRDGTAVASADRRPQLIEPFATQEEAHDLILDCNRYHEGLV